MSCCLMVEKRREDINYNNCNNVNHKPPPRQRQPKKGEKRTTAGNQRRRKEREENRNKAIKGTTKPASRAGRTATEKPQHQQQLRRGKQARIFTSRLILSQLRREGALSIGRLHMMSNLVTWYRLWLPITSAFQELRLSIQ